MELLKATTHYLNVRKQPRKEEDSFAEYEEALLNFELRVRTPDLPFRRPDLLYINPQVEDSHPFPLIVSELTSEHQNNGQLGSTDDTNGEERRVERWTVVTLQAYAETNSHTLRHTALCPLTFARWGISPWKSCGLLRARRPSCLIRVCGNLENGDLSPSTRHAAILSSKHVLIKRFIRARRKNTLCEEGRWSNQAN
ncbi:hypothetical protein T08_10496 [Trichinella sp. T8]|nr:hypothetical protein T08_10496 [Trichinella sp. T8]